MFPHFTFKRNGGGKVLSPVFKAESRIYAEFEGFKEAAPVVNIKDHWSGLTLEISRMTAKEILELAEELREIGEYLSLKVYDRRGSTEYVCDGQEHFMIQEGEDQSPVFITPCDGCSYNSRHELTEAELANLNRHRHGE